ncbi:MAG: ComF family protein [Gammaproteobacteria bacterium]|nr:ComF family protein [Gammaproteobacteria bacterium]
MIKNIKYKQTLSLISPLASQLIDQIVKTCPNKIDLLVPVPTPRSRLVLRGMNQALEIAKLVGRELSIPVDNHRLKRTRYTPPMHALDLSQRQQNVLGAFSWTGTPPDSVAIIDDVITSGATCSAICRGLKSKGALHVEAWALARVC